jgi:putative Holliday junction resolvase
LRKGIRYAIDFGDARVGLAKSDIDGILAVPVATIENNQELIKKITEHITESGCMEIYVGLPKHLSGVIGQAANKAINFAQQLAKTLPDISMRMLDERLTTTSASARLSESGVNTRQQKGMIDQVAAIELLEQALEFEKRNNQVPGIDLKEVK